MQPFLTQLLDLTLIQLTNWRWTWRTQIITGVLAPLLSALALGTFAQSSGPVALGYVLTGSVVVSLLFSSMDKVSSHFAYMRVVGRLDYYAALPVYRVALILATALSFLVISLPPVLVTLVVSALILQVPLAISPWLLIVIPLASLCLCGLGALIGVIGRTPEETGALSMMTTFLLLGLGPVVIPPDRLPAIVDTVSLLSPARYAAAALRETIIGLPDRFPLVVNLGVLLAVMLALLWLAGRKVDWRGR